MDDSGCRAQHLCREHAACARMGASATPRSTSQTHFPSRLFSAAWPGLVGGDSENPAAGLVRGSGCADGGGQPDNGQAQEYLASRAAPRPRALRFETVACHPCGGPRSVPRHMRRVPGSAADSGKRRVDSQAANAPGPAAHRVEKFCHRHCGRASHLGRRP